MKIIEKLDHSIFIAVEIIVEVKSTTDSHIQTFSSSLCVNLGLYEMFWTFLWDYTGCMGLVAPKPLSSGHVWNETQWGVPLKENNQWRCGVIQTIGLVQPQRWLFSNNNVVVVCFVMVRRSRAPTPCWRTHQTRVCSYGVFSYLRTSWERRWTRTASV